MKNTLLFVFLLTVFTSGFAQKEVSGTVGDASGVPLPGVTVMVQGTANGTTTDFDGNYSIRVAEGQVLVFSYIGFTKKELTVGTSNIMDVTLEEDVQSLNEVVVVGFGTQKNTFL